MELEKRSSETPLQYQKRLIYGKLVDKTLSDVDYAELSEYVYGQQYSSDVARRMMYGSKRTLDLIEDEKISNVKDESLLSEIDSKMIDLKKEQQRFYDQRTAFNKVVRERTREEELNDILIQSVSNGNLPSLNFRHETVPESDNDLLVSLNDIHYGIDISNAWNTYSPEICAQRMDDYLSHILDIAKRHHSENCIVFNCGDNISGKIHMTIQIANRENVVEQVKGVSELISQFLGYLAPHFKTVRYVSVSGNHSRLDTKDNSPYDERLDDLVEWYLQARLHDIDNIEICTKCRVDPTMFMIPIRGKLYCGVHGDFDGSATNIAALQAMANQPLYAVLSGHRHFNRCEEVQGIKTVMAGSFMGADDYCITKRLFSRPEQMVCVCDDTGIVCHYEVML